MRFKIRWEAKQPEYPIFIAKQRGKRLLLSKLQTPFFFHYLAVVRPKSKWVFQGCRIKMNDV